MPKLKYLKQAYHHRSKNCHPDKFLNTEHMEMATEVQKLINQAYITFCSYDGTYRYISSGKPPKEFLHGCQAIKDIIVWIHDRVKMREGEKVGRSSETNECSQTVEAKVNEDPQANVSSVGKNYHDDGSGTMKEDHTASDGFSNPGTVVEDLSQLQVSSSL